MHGTGRVAVALAIAAAVAGACRNERQKRAGDAAPVEVVATPVIADAGVGGTSDEVEPNDAEDVANPLGAGATVHARIDPDSDADFYRIDIPGDGVLAVELATPEAMDLTLELFDQTGSMVAKSDRGAARMREGLPNVGVSTGKYYAVVRAKKLAPATTKSGKRRAPPVDAAVAHPVVTPYEITARLTAHVAASEREPDDDRGTANDVIPGDTVTGFIGWTADVDVWKLSVETLSASNALDIEVSAVENVALVLELVDGIGRTLATRKAPRGAPLIARGFVPVVPPGASPFHYLTIRGDRSNPDAGYQLRITAKPLGMDAEIEPNDAVDKAMPVPPDRTVVAGSWSSGDIDCYALSRDPAARSVDAMIETPTAVDLAGELFIDGTSAAKADHPGKGAAERVTAPVPAGAQPVLCVRGSDSAGEGSYEVKFQDGPAGPP
ncbi:MAG: hypothetical protein AB7R00_00985 [Kofleriaceae bacterium]